MNRTIETRELITIPVGDICLRGTYHRRDDKTSASQAGFERTDRIGVLFVNSGFLPRAASGDSPVYWADSFAKSGYPSFRFDLPGLGDSDGDVPTRFLDFVNTGGYAPLLSLIISELITRFSLWGIVIAGHCSGAVTALYTAAASKDCKGLVLIDPYFSIPREKPKIEIDVIRLVSRSRFGGYARRVYYFLRHTGLLLRRYRVPKDANLPLLRCWAQVASAGTPILILNSSAWKTSGLKPRIGQFDYFGYLQKLAGQRSRSVVHFIEDTNHSFANQGGQAAVRQLTEQWLNECFPREAHGGIGPMASAHSHAQTPLSRPVFRND